MDSEDIETFKDVALIILKYYDQLPDEMIVELEELKPQSWGFFYALIKTSKLHITANQNAITVINTIIYSRLRHSFFIAYTPVNPLYAKL